MALALLSAVSRVFVKPLPPRPQPIPRAASREPLSRVLGSSKVGTLEKRFDPKTGAPYWIVGKYNPEVEKIAFKGAEDPNTLSR